MKKLGLILAAMLMLVGCGGGGSADSSKDVLKVGMECMYAPYNWTQADDSNGAVPIEGSKEFAAGYDVEMAKKVAEALGKELVVVKTEWDGLPPAVQSGKIDLIMAGMSPTAERKENIDFSNPYWVSDLIMVVKSDSPYVNATKLEDFNGAKLTGQLNTVHYTVLEQIPGADVQEPMADFMQERVALQSGKIDGYVAETPEGISVESAMDGVTYITFAPEDGFQTDETDRQVAAGMKKGSDLMDKVNEVFDGITAEERQAIMEEAIKNQPSEQ